MFYPNHDKQFDAEFKQQYRRERRQTWLFRVGLVGLGLTVFITLPIIVLGLAYLLTGGEVTAL